MTWYAAIMEAHNVERRLAAILAADVVGYSRLMEVDEAGTLARLKTVRLELIHPAIAKCKGRIIKTTGDGLLVEFQSVTEALRCAVDFQERMARRNRDMPSSRALLYRIGLNLGDVIVDESDIFGDGVNVAARLELIAEPGGICISGRCGIRSATGWTSSTPISASSRSRTSTGRFAFSKSCRSASPRTERFRSSAAPIPANAKKPSIAVLPFVNMSGDPEQEFFADGLTEDIITELSRFRQLLVISRNAVFVRESRSRRSRSRENSAWTISSREACARRGSRQSDRPAHRRRN